VDVFAVGGLDAVNGLCLKSHVPRTLLRFSRWPVVVALLLAIGAHWALLQTVAWAAMLVDYSRTGAFTEAVEKTFDGQHPCALCKEIQKGRQSEKKQAMTQVVKKIDLFDERSEAVVAAMTVALPATKMGYLAELRSHPPAVPPPREG
jgi:hypothetical protein